MFVERMKVFELVIFLTAIIPFLLILTVILKKVFPFFTLENAKALFKDFVKLAKIFLVFNLAVFFVVGISQSLFRVHPAAKFFMSNAVAVNTLYIFPLSHVFGWDNIFVQPFYPLREGLYRIGLALLPKDDGEREMWWFAVRYTEFEKFASRDIYKKETYKNDRKVEKLLAYTDELYDHIEPFATLKIKDEKLRSRRYGLLVDVFYEYLLKRRYFVSNKEPREEVEVGGCTTFNIKFLSNTKEINKFRHLLNIFAEFYEYTEHKEPEGLEHFRNKTIRYYYDTLFIHLVTEEIWVSDLVTGNLNCNDPILSLYALARYKAKLYMFDTKLPVPDRNRINIFALGTGPEHIELLKKCSVIEYLYLQDIEDDVERRNNYFKALPRGNVITNDYYEKLSLWKELKKVYE